MLLDKIELEKISVRLDFRLDRPRFILGTLILVGD